MKCSPSRKRLESLEKWNFCASSIEKSLKTNLSTVNVCAPHSLTALKFLPNIWSSAKPQIEVL